MADHAYCPFKRAAKWAVMQFWTAAYSIARLRGGRTSTYNSPLLYGSGDKLMGESSFVITPIPHRPRIARIATNRFFSYSGGFVRFH